MSHSEQTHPYEHEDIRYQRVRLPGIEPECHIDPEVEGHVHHGARSLATSKHGLVLAPG